MHMWYMKDLRLMVQNLWERLKFLEMWVKGDSQRYKVIDLGAIWKGFNSWVCMPNKKSLSLVVQNLWPRLVFLPQED